MTTIKMIIGDLQTNKILLNDYDDAKCMFHQYFCHCLHF